MPFAFLLFTSALLGCDAAPILEAGAVRTGKPLWQYNFVTAGDWTIWTDESPGRPDYPTVNGRNSVTGEERQLSPPGIRCLRGGQAALDGNLLGFQIEAWQIGATDIVTGEYQLCSVACCSTCPGTAGGGVGGWNGYNYAVGVQGLAIDFYNSHLRLNEVETHWVHDWATNCTRPAGE